MNRDFPYLKASATRVAERFREALDVGADPSNLPSDLKSRLNAALNREGLSGQGTFSTVREAFSATLEVLGDGSLYPPSSPISGLFPETPYRALTKEKGDLSFGLLARTRERGSKPVMVRNANLQFYWTTYDENSVEVVAFIQ